MSRWIQDHPSRDEDLAPLWWGLENDNDLNYQLLRKAVREAASRADVTKPVTFTNLRKSSASYIPSQGVNQPVLEDHHGWVRGSKVASRYVVVFGEAIDGEIARAHGVDVSDEEPEPIAAVPCPRCGEKTSREEPICMWCHQAIEPWAVDEIEAEQHSKRRQLMGFAKEQTEPIDRLDEIEPLVEAVDGDVDVIETARKFVDEAEPDSETGHRSPSLVAAR